VTEKQIIFHRRRSFCYRVSELMQGGVKVISIDVYCPVGFLCTITVRVNGIRQDSYTI